MKNDGRLFTGFTREERREIKYVVSDVDDTITTDGLLLPSALEAMYDLKASGRRLILVTGGSAGWADGYMRQWPVDAVIAESGAVLLTRTDGRMEYTMNPLIEENPETMERRNAFMEATKDMVFSSDQYARIFDIAYERAAMTEEDEEDLFLKIRRAGAVALVSSIHVNVLFAHLSKAVGLETFYPILREKLGLDAELETFLFHALALGDSTNDEALFRAVRYSAGNKRVRDRIDEFHHLPLWTTEKYGGSSFSFIIENLIGKN